MIMHKPASVLENDTPRQQDRIIIKKKSEFAEWWTLLSQPTTELN